MANAMTRNPINQQHGIRSGVPEDSMEASGLLWRNDVPVAPLRTLCIRGRKTQARNPVMYICESIKWEGYGMVTPSSCSGIAAIHQIAFVDVFCLEHRRLPVSTTERRMRTC